MIRKIRSPLSAHVRVIFELPAYTGANQIHVVGNFNSWSLSATPMQQEQDGVWRALVDLPNGSRCEFRYLIDGQWKSDQHADGLTRNAYGSQNSVVFAYLPVDNFVLQRISSQVWDPARRPIEGLPVYELD